MQNNKQQVNSNKNICIVVPYTKGFSESFKNISGNWESNFILKKETPSETSLGSPRQRTPSHRKVE